MVNCDTIIDWIKSQVESKNPIDPNLWMDACSKLIVLVGDETDKLFDLQQEVSHLKTIRIENKESVSQAKVYVEATDAFKNMQKQKAKIERIFEMIRISKIRARLAIDEYKSQ